MEHVLRVSSLFIIGCILLAAPARAQVLAGGEFYSLVRCSDGGVQAWGYDLYGQLGNGSNNESHVPEPVNSLTGVIAISAEYLHSMALRDDSTVWAWGINNFGQLGNGNNTDSNVPVQVSVLTGVVSMAAGGFQGLALKKDSTVWAWGFNNYGALGNGTNTDSNVPVQVYSLTGIVAISAGAEHSLAVKKDSTVWAWGSNNLGALGNGTNADSNVPTQVDTLTGVIAVAGGDSHSLALKGDGTVWAWGANASGQLGNGTENNSTIPVQVTSLTGITAIAAGGSHSLALKIDGTVWAWGSDTHGELGNGSATWDSTVPVQMDSLTGVVAIAGGTIHSLALKNDGTLWTCGYNAFGALGDGSTTDRYAPVHIMGLCDLTSAVQEIPADASITLSPNPTSGAVVIDGGRPSALKTVEVTNAMGQRIIATSFTNKREVLDLSAQPSGLYFITIRGEGRPYFGKVIKE